MDAWQVVDKLTEINKLLRAFKDSDPVNNFKKHIILKNCSKKLNVNLSIYYQINTSYTKDYRLFVQPRIYYSLKKIDLFFDSTYRFHSTPYIDVLTTDASLTIGVEFSL